MSPKRPLRRTPLPTFLLHWGLVLALGVSLATGLRIAADAADARVSAALAPMLPQGSVHLWHLAAGATVFGLLLAYTLYQVYSGLGRRLLAGWLRGEVPPVGWRRIHLWLYWAAFLLLATAVATGLAQYAGALPWDRATLEALHRTAAWGLLAYLVLHVGFYFAAGGVRGLLAIFLPQQRLVGIGALTAGIGALGALGMVSADRFFIMPLEIAWADRVPVLDGRVDDPAWQYARPVRLRLGNGANLPGGETEVKLRGVHDGERVFLLCEWDDSTRSQKLVPLHKTEEGWRILQTAYRRADESQYYEDKLAIMLSASSPLAAMASIHLGQAPLAGQPGAPGGRGLHYTTDGSLLDVWHWKSVRNGAQHQADDNFFAAALPAPAATPRQRDPDSGGWFYRYAAGYRKDPPGTYGGYETNWEYFSEGISQPLRLPEDPRDLAQLGAVDLSPERSDQGQWWLEFNDTRPFAAGADQLPVGTLLPSILPTGKLTGDRGDVRARGYWDAGRWHLELSRRLDTGSDKDVPVTDGTLLWVAVFDHAQTRHAYHLRPLRVHLAPRG